jgi:D-psicose/D-tagatose/L-ribulose 3-epimerase
MKYCMNLLLWTGSLSEDDLPIIEELKEMGYDGVEIPMFEAGDAAQNEKMGKQLDDLGLGRTAVTILGLDTNPISPDAAVRQKGVEAMQAVLDGCAATGVETLVGPFHSALGEFSGNFPTADEWNWGVDSMRKMSEHAGKVGVNLAVEPLNRFETYLLNTQADAAKFAREVDHPNCGMLYDTFHANIEEKSVSAAIEACADKMIHVHISENDRSTPGQGGVNWKENFDTLHKVGYDGWMAVEAFGSRLPEIAAATKIWRRMFETEMQLAQDALTFMKTEVAKRWS